MCEEVMTLSNDLIYKGKLKCGNEQVAKRTLQIPHIGGLVRLHSSGQDTQCGSGPCWIRDLFVDRYVHLFEPFPPAEKKPY